MIFASTHDATSKFLIFLLSVTCLRRSYGLTSSFLNLLKPSERVPSLMPIVGIMVRAVMMTLSLPSDSPLSCEEMVGAKFTPALMCLLMFIEALIRKLKRSYPVCFTIPSWFKYPAEA